MLLIIEYKSHEYSIEVDLDDGVEMLKVQLFSLLQLQPEEQIIKYNSIAIQDNTNLTSVGLTQGDRLVISSKIGIQDLHSLSTPISTLTTTGSSGSASTTTTSTSAPPQLNPSEIAATLRALAVALPGLFPPEPSASSTSSPSLSSSAVSSFSPIRLDITSSCTRSFFGDGPISQPGVQSRLSSLPICRSCAVTCLLPNAWIPRSQQTPFMCQCINIPNHYCLFTERAISAADMLYGNIKTQALSHLAQAQRGQVATDVSPSMHQMMSQLKSHQITVMEYENPHWQAEARKVIPLMVLTERANKALLESQSSSSSPKSDFRDQLLFELLRWFKFEFFQWTNSPECERCKGETNAIGGTVPNADELPFRPGVVELYRCKSCGFVTRFPRYNHACKLLETRKGRCGEWAQCFTLCCRSLGYESRAVYDWTDHVWTECYSNNLKRWIHLDSCEAERDKPLLYESGWGKKLSYIIAFSVDEIIDVTKRYTRKYQDVLTRRTAVPEEWLSHTLNAIQNEKYSKVTQERKILLIERRKEEVKELAGTLTEVKDEDKKENKSLIDQELAGRTTGSVEWRKARGELGNEEKTAQAVKHQEQIKREINKDNKSKPENEKILNQQPQLYQSSSKNSVSSSIPATLSTATPSSNPSTDNDPKAKVKFLFQSYHKQLKEGCGNSSCLNEYCASSNNFKFKAKTPTTQEISQLCLTLTSQYKYSKLCSRVS